LASHMTTMMVSSSRFAAPAWEPPPVGSHIARALARARSPLSASLAPISVSPSCQMVLVRMEYVIPQHVHWSGSIVYDLVDPMCFSTLQWPERSGRAHAAQGFSMLADHFLTVRSFRNTTSWSLTMCDCMQRYESGPRWKRSASRPPLPR
jgi:hypothetical protein